MGGKLRVDSALKALSTLRGLRGAPEVPPLCRETQSLGQQMKNAPLGINGLRVSPRLKKIHFNQLNRYYDSKSFTYAAEFDIDVSFNLVSHNYDNEFLFSFKLKEI